MPKLKEIEKAGPANSMADVIARLKIRPQQVTATLTAEGPDLDRFRQYTKFYYPFEGKLDNFGEYTRQIAQDISQAGAVAMEIQPIASGLRPGTDQGMYEADPSKAWHCLIEVRVKSIVELEDLQAGFNAFLGQMRSKAGRL